MQPTFPTPLERTARALASGFSAGVAMLALFLGSYGALRLLTDSPGPRGVLETWEYNLVHNRLLDHASSGLYTAFEIHTAIALTFSLLYAFVLEPRLRGNGALRGATASLIPWLLSVCVFLPLVGAGFLGLGLNAGPLPMVGNLALHLVFGVVLGVMYDASSDVVIEAGYGAVDRTLTERICVGAVKGLIFGFVAALATTPFLPTVATFSAYWAGLLLTLLGMLLGVMSALPGYGRSVA